MFVDCEACGVEMFEAGAIPVVDEDEARELGTFNARVLYWLCEDCAHEAWDESGDA